MGGGSSGSAPTADTGVRSLLAPWMGGASSSGSAPTADTGVRSLLAFWTGGASSLGGIIPPTVPDVYPGSGHPAGIWWGERKIKRGKRLDDVLRRAMEYLLEAGLDVPDGSPAARAVDAIAPFVTDGIDWKAVEKNKPLVRELLNLWQEQKDSLEEEEALLMMLAH